METIAPGANVPDAPATDAVGPAEVDGPGTAEPPAEDAGDDYQSLWETTIHRSVEEAAVRIDEAEESGEGAPSTGAEPSPGGLVSGVPQDLPSASAPVDPDGPDGFDHDGHTVMGSSVSDLRAVAAAAAAQLAASSELPAFSAPPAPPAPSGPPAAAPGEQPVAGPQLVARLCVSGHANPPSRERCAVCGLALSGETRAVARPALGRVRVTIGEGGEPQVLPLDRPLVVGRRPRSPKGANQGGEGALHRIVTVPSPQQDISRSHVEVRLEGWNVLAVDLNTTNGTTLLRPGQTPLRMHPGDPLLVVSGDVVDLGDGVALAFEDVP
ncbi:FHA domain-containing protein [Luteimicrobium album]|nr:FHA domain-containing protein [Luteimicrobium album]